MFLTGPVLVEILGTPLGRPCRPIPSIRPCAHYQCSFFVQCIRSATRKLSSERADIGRVVIMPERLHCLFHLARVSDLAQPGLECPPLAKKLINKGPRASRDDILECRIKLLH